MAMGNVEPARPDRVPRRSRSWSLLALAVVSLASGCLGPQAIRQTRLRYNEAYRVTSAEQILLNIVRLRYADSPQFLDLPSITSQFEVTGHGGYVGGLDGQGPGRTNLGTGELFFRDAPTLSYAPKKGKQFGRALANPLTVELIRLVLGTTSFGPFLLLAVNDVNDVSNAPQAVRLLPQSPADNAAFREVVDLVTQVYRRDGLELIVDTTEVPTSDPVLLPNVRGDHLLAAARSDYVYRAEGPERLTLKKRQKSLALRVRPHEIHSFEMNELARRLRLTPGLETYRLRSELLDDEEDDFETLPNPLGDDTIFLNMRSTLEIMTFLSKGVCVPPEHVASGVAPTLRDPAGRPFDWTRVTAGLFAVQSGTRRPKHAEVAVRYRDRWFWIDRQDVASRGTLTTLELLLSLQESGEEEAGPLLTLPVGG